MSYVKKIFFHIFLREPRSIYLSESLKYCHTINTVKELITISHTLA